MDRVRLDLNHPVFQEDWFALESAEAARVFATLVKISKLSWNERYRDRGLRWEAIRSRKGPQGRTLYSLRITQKMRAVAYRDGNVLQLLELHPDHDSAYQ